MKYTFFSIKLCLILILVSSFSTLSAQTPEEVKADPDQYIWGEGVGPTVKKADDEALMMLISQISARVESSFEMTQTETNRTIQEKVQSIVKTYSAATLKNTQRLVISDEPNAKVFRFIKRMEITSIFNERKNKILSFVNFGNASTDQLQISDGLKYYYWALILLRSHPDGSKIVAPDGSLMSVWLTNRINSIFAGLTAEVADLIKGNGYTTAVLNIKYNNASVSNFDFSYWDGKVWSGLCGAKDGLASAELAGNLRELKSMRLRSEYIFENEANFDNELKEVLQSCEPIPFRNHVLTAKCKLPTMVVKEMEVALENKVPATTTAPSVNRIKTDATGQANAIAPDNVPIKKATEELLTEVPDQTPYEKSVLAVKKAIVTGQYAEVQPLFTAQGYEFFQKLVQYGSAKILRNQPLQFVRQGKEVLCRSIPMSFSFKNSNKQFVEELVIRFDSTMKINELTFALGQKAIADLMSKTVWSDKVKLQIIDFIESYKTAYALKRLDYIEKIFSDDALIIVGSFLNVNTGEPNPYRTNRIVKYNRYTKQEYIKKLKQAFGSTEFINLKFEENEVRKSGKGGEVYGIQIRQNFNSPNYADFGYLFLLMDFNNPTTPVIHVRTWQPEKNKDGSIYGLNDFN